VLFRSAPGRLAQSGDDMLPLFGYVVDALREASLPTEYALIPMIESGYRPGARSPAGPAGLWQMIALTARNHGVPIRPGYDGRLSPVESTRAAVRYLKTLHGMFAGDWRLAAMAYNAGEYRIFGALKRAGQNARNARPERLPGVTDMTHAYVRKIHALSCVLEQADGRDEWLRSLDRPVPRLQAITPPAPIQALAGWADQAGQDLAQLRRLNPAFVDGRISESRGKRAPLLAAAPASGGLGGLASSAESSAPTSTAPTVDVVAHVPATAASATASSTPSRVAPAESKPPRRHTVRPGENTWLIAKRYGVRVADLLQRNPALAGGKLRPGQVLQIDALAGAGE